MMHLNCLCLNLNLLSRLSQTQHSLLTYMGKSRRRRRHCRRAELASVSDQASAHLHTPLLEESKDENFRRQGSRNIVKVVSDLALLFVPFLPLLVVIGYYVILRPHIPKFPSVSVESMSITVINMPSTTTRVLTANLETVFLIENQNQNHSIAYDHINILGFHYRSLNQLSYNAEKLFYNMSVAPLKQDKGTIKVQMDGVAVDVAMDDDGRSWVFFVGFELRTSVTMKEGKWLKRTSGMNTVCQALKMVVSANETRKVEFQPAPNECGVIGWWKIFRLCMNVLIISIFTMQFVHYCIDIPKDARI